MLSAWESEDCSAAIFYYVLQLVQQHCVASLGFRGVLCGHSLLFFTTHSATLCHQFGSQGIGPRQLSIDFYNYFSNMVLSFWRSEESSTATFSGFLQANSASLCYQFGSQRIAPRPLSRDLTSNSAALCYQPGTQRSPPWQLSIVFCN